MKKISNTINTDNTIAVIDGIKITRNPTTGGFSAVFEHGGEHFYADCSHVMYTGPETMIFHADENGEVTDWGELWCDRPEWVSPEKLIEAIRAFKQA